MGGGAPHSHQVYSMSRNRWEVSSNHNLSLITNIKGGYQK
nr:MAG TPA: hypothetical protein [Caudoviricetes sp.]